MRVERSDDELTGLVEELRQPVARLGNEKEELQRENQARQEKANQWDAEIRRLEAGVKQYEDTHAPSRNGGNGRPHGIATIRGDTDADRYASVEVNYLIQRIESYDGVVLLTTNLESNIDSAFMRRIDHSVEFRRPREDIRLAIWEDIFPAQTPTAELDREFLAGVGLTGEDIRPIAQTAAIFSADDDGVVTMRHVVRGLQRELQKPGKMDDPQKFGDYRKHLHR